MTLHHRNFGFQLLAGMDASVALGLFARRIGAGPDGNLNELTQALQTVGSIFISGTLCSMTTVLGYGGCIPRDI